MALFSLTGCRRRPLLTMPLLGLFCALGPSVLLTRPCHAQADILPGRSIWHIRLGMSAAQVKKAANPLEFVRHLRNGVTVWGWENDPPILLRGGHVIQDQISSAGETTPDGLHCGSTLAEVQARNKSMRHMAYTVHDAAGHSYEVDVYDNVARGIAFEIEPESGPGSPISVGSIIVHLPGHAVLPDDNEGYHTPRR